MLSSTKGQFRVRADPASFILFCFWLVSTASYAEPKCCKYIDLSSVQTIVEADPKCVSFCIAY